MASNRGIRALFSALLVGSIVLTSVPAFGAAPKVGSTCSKSGQKLVVKKVTYSCSKVGTKLKWKVVVAKSPAPKIIEPRIALPTNFELPLNFDKFSSDTLEISLLLVKKAFSEAKSATVENKIIRGPSVTDEAIAESNGQLQKAINLLSSKWVPKTISSLYFTQNDGSWIDSAISNAGGNPNWVSASQEPYSKLIQRWESIGIAASACNTGTAQQTANGPLWIQCLGTKASRDGRLSVAPHEYFHLFQQAFKQNERKVQWADEGTANFFGAVVGLYLSETSMSSILMFRSNQARGFDPQLKEILAQKNLPGLVQRFKQLELGGNGEIDNSGYMLGQYASELLVAVGGWDKFLQLNMRAEKNLPFASAFKEIYGLTLDEFYPKAAAYIFSQ